MEIPSGNLCVGSTVYGNDGTLFNGLEQSLQGVPSLMRSVLDLVNFAGGNVPGVNPTNPFSIQVDLEHNLCGRLTVFAKKLLQYPDNKLHGREIVIEHDHLVHLRRLGALGASL